MGPLAGAGIARATGLSAQSASVVSRALEADGLLLRRPAVRGRVGKPSVPLALNPDGLFSLGLRIGRRRVDMVAIDLVGRLRGREVLNYAYPTPSSVTGFAGEAVRRLRSALPGGTARLAGIGVATPFELWNWHDQLGAPPGEMRAWRSFDLAAEIAALSALPVIVGNDATLACAGEQAFGASAGPGDFAYFYVGAFVGGGIVLNGRIHQGPDGNAGAFGSLPLRDPDTAGHQLIDHASIYLLERRLAEEGKIRPGADLTTMEWAGFGEALDDWISVTARHLAMAIVATTAVLSLPRVVIDGSFPDAVRTRLVAVTRARLARADTRGIRRPDVVEGSLGVMAGALGSAYQPIMEGYLSP
nr:ROK family protein [Jannaschia sp. S6380]